MKKFVAIVLSCVLATSIFAASSKKPQSFEKVKKAKIAKLQVKLETIQKRISCIKKSKNSKDIKVCEKRYPLVKRSKSKKHKKSKK
ncbi:hypothetical protein [Nitratiruptor sp. YY09-18]|uniref:hypothetical protein n=1 Tax=Nitratiruptor sp. YY09-18 TaxID=2724901 RepID=UPI001915299B|nr:hypothetical protein [Nitratiruptor sp. YY09-18]BCD67596.1 hypothetical protein NitYY0918_C0495 [Nitratiruptor sp. YY09-18]